MMTKKTRPTLNMNWAERRNSLADQFLLNSNSDYIYLLNPTPEAVRLALQAGKKVIGRIFDPFGDYEPNNSFDNQYHYKRSPQEVYIWFVNSPFAEFHHTNTYWLIGQNEPTADSEADIKKGNAWAVQYGKLMIADGYKVALGGWNVAKSIRMGWNDEKKHATAPDVDAGHWDDVLQFAHENTEDVIIDLHTYTVGRAWGQLKKGFPFDREAMSSPPDEPLKWGERLNGGHYPYWHFGRSNALIVRIKQMGWNQARFGIGESIWDNMADLKVKVAEMRERFGIERFMDDMRGLPSLRRYYAYLADVKDELYSDDMFANDAWQDVKWIDSELPENFEYIATYAWNVNILWTAFDVSGPSLRPFVHNMATYGGRVFEQPELPELPELGDALPALPDITDNGWKTGTLTIVAQPHLNIRATPSKDSEPLGKLTRQYSAAINVAKEFPNEGYIWTPVIIQSFFQGWIAESSLADPDDEFYTFVPASVAIPDAPEPEPEIPVPVNDKQFVDFGAFSKTMTKFEILLLIDKFQNEIERAQRIIIALENAEPVGNVTEARIMMSPMARATARINKKGNE